LIILEFISWSHLHFITSIQFSRYK
jgi:hypothetical protein